jgi:hypothetical protein
MYLDEPKFTSEPPLYIKKYFLMYQDPLKRYIWFIWFIKKHFLPKMRILHLGEMPKAEGVTAIPPEKVGIPALSAHPPPADG